MRLFYRRILPHMDNAEVMRELDHVWDTLNDMDFNTKWVERRLRDLAEYVEDRKQALEQALEVAESRILELECELYGEPSTNDTDASDRSDSYPQSDATDGQAQRAVRSGV